MIFYRKRAKTPSVTRRIYRFGAYGGCDTTSEENLLDLDEGRLSINFTAESGVIQNVKGSCRADPHVFGVHPLPRFDNEVIGLFSYNSKAANGNVVTKLIVQTSDYSLYSVTYGYFDTVSLIGSPGRKVSASANVRQGDSDVVVFTTTNGLYMFDGTTFSHIDGSPEAFSVVKHKERLFAVVMNTANRIWFSRTGDITDWTISEQTGGYIDVPVDGGSILTLVSLGEYLYIFSEYAVYRLSVWASQSEFELKTACKTPSRILQGSVALAGDSVIMRCLGGFYAFDGVVFSHVMKSLDGANVNGISNCVSAYSCGKYYLACRVTASPEYKNGTSVNRNSLTFCYDLAKRVGTLWEGIPYVSLLSFESRNISVLLTAESQTNGNDASHYVGMLQDGCTDFARPLIKTFRSGFGDLKAQDKKKSLRYVLLTTSAPLKFTVNADGQTSDYYVSGSTRQQRIAINKPFNRFSFGIETSAENVKVLNPAFAIDFYGE